MKIQAMKILQNEFWQFSKRGLHHISTSVRICVCVIQDKLKSLDSFLMQIVEFPKLAKSGGSYCNWNLMETKSNFHFKQTDRKSNFPAGKGSK